MSWGGSGFFINVPIGIVGLALALWLVPVLPTHTHRFDLVGVALSNDQGSYGRHSFRDD